MNDDDQLQDEITQPSYKLWQGQRVPLLISVPHSGTSIPQEVLAQMTDSAQGSMDSDWFMKELYLPIAQDLGASLITPHFSRYVIDLNRPSLIKVYIQARLQQVYFPNIASMEKSFIKIINNQTL